MKNKIFAWLLLAAILPLVVGVHVVYISCSCNHVRHADIELTVGGCSVDICAENIELCTSGNHCCGSHEQHNHEHHAAACSSSPSAEAQLTAECYVASVERTPLPTAFDVFFAHANCLECSVFTFANKQRTRFAPELQPSVPPDDLCASLCVFLC